MTVQINDSSGSLGLVNTASRSLMYGEVGGGDDLEVAGGFQRSAQVHGDRVAVAHDLGVAQPPQPQKLRVSPQNSAPIHESPMCD